MILKNIRVLHLHKLNIPTHFGNSVETSRSQLKVLSDIPAAAILRQRLLKERNEKQTQCCLKSFVHVERSCGQGAPAISEISITD